jgi:hypothetical protein
VKSWNLNEFLTASQIEACAKTGATLQWLDEGAFLEQNFYFKGPSHRIRALNPSFTIMRGVDAKVTFSGLLDAENATIHLDEAKEP